MGRRKRVRGKSRISASDMEATDDLVSEDYRIPTITTRSPTASLSEESRTADQSRTVSFFGSSKNVGVSDSQFVSAAGHHISVTVNVGNIERPEVGGLSPSELSQSKESFPDDYTTDNETLNNDLQFLRIERSCDIYYRYLLLKSRGTPLWIPGPNQTLPVQYRRKGTMIGDVGIITGDGSFDFIFNICRPRDDPINPDNLPDTFSHIYIRADDIKEHSLHSGPSHLSSSSVKKEGDSGLHFECSASEGAILIMPTGMRSENLANKAQLRKYAADNAEMWYKYINEVRGREAENGDIRLVIGSDKAAAWGMATFSNVTIKESAFYLKFLPRDGRWEYSGMAEVRNGPDPAEVAALQAADTPHHETEYVNQCLFLRTLNIRLRDEVWDKLGFNYGEVEVEDRPRNIYDKDNYRRFQSASGGTSSNSSSPNIPSYQPSFVSRNYGKACGPIHFPSSTMALAGHPSSLLNDRLLKSNPDARLVITDDSDWISVIRTDDLNMPSAKQLYSRILATHDVCVEDGIVFLVKREADIAYSYKLKTKEYPSRETPIKGNAFGYSTLALWLSGKLRHFTTRTLDVYVSTLLLLYSWNAEYWTWMTTHVYTVIISLYTFGLYRLLYSLLAFPPPKSYRKNSTGNSLQGRDLTAKQKIQTAVQWRSKVTKLITAWKFVLFVCIILFAVCLINLLVNDSGNSIAGTCAWCSLCISVAGVFTSSVYLKLKSSLMDMTTRDKWIEASNNLETEKSTEFWAFLSLPIGCLAWAVIFFFATLFLTTSTKPATRNQSQMAHQVNLYEITWAAILFSACGYVALLHRAVGSLDSRK